MDLQLKGKTAVVTGGSRGIGRSIAELFADEGANVAICARNAEQVAEAVESLKRRGGEAWGRAVDIADGAALKRFVGEAGERLGGIDVMVSNASALVNGAAEADWQAMFDIDMLGAVRTFDAAFPFLEKAAEANGDAAFVIVSSVSAAETNGGSAYGPMKAALIHYAKGLARQHAAKKVRANVVSPGTVLFDGGVWGNVRDQMPGYFERMLKRNPTGRMATPEEIAAAVVFLASPRSAFTTGSNLLVDGAISARVNF
ncbi:SDR family NAD(P)-dependent oxidoreductase [Phenylobacterium sp.]|uniref:SDR family NAD(P)-dependent oxidoreductase n=1 Tax=Phenylobacterium sp. TaxID=1871053 RepID=UPI0035AE2E41